MAQHSLMVPADSIIDGSVSNLYVLAVRKDHLDLMIIRATQLFLSRAARSKLHLQLRLIRIAGERQEERWLAATLYARASFWKSWLGGASARQWEKAANAQQPPCHACNIIRFWKDTHLQWVH